MSRLNKYSDWLITLGFIIFLIVLHIFLKTLYFDQPSIWYDEAYSIFHSQYTIDHIIENAMNDQNPPVYNIILFYWIKQFGNSVESVRFLSVLFSVLSVPLLFYLAKKYINISAALIASTLYLVWNEMIFYSMEARCYTFVGFLVLISVFLFLNLMLKKNYALLTVIALSIVNVLLILSHYLSVFFLISQFIFYIVFYARNYRVTIYYLISIVISIALFIPWLLKIVEIIKLTGGGDYWLKAATLNDLNFLIEGFFNNYYTFIFIAIIIIVGTILLKKNRQLNSFYYLFLFWAILPAIVSYIASQFIPVFLGRYILYSIFGFILLLAYILSNPSINKYYRYGTLLILLVLLIIQVDLNPKKNQDIKSAVNYIVKNTDDKTLIILSPRSISIPFSYYYDTLIFNNLIYFEWELLKKNVLLVDTKEELNRINLAVYDKIINLRSFENFFDKDKVIRDSIGAKFELIKEEYFDDASIRVYRNTNYLDGIKKIFQNASLSNISFYCPFNLIYTDSINYYKIQKGVKNNAVINYKLENGLKNNEFLNVKFKSLLQSVDNSVLLNVISMDNLQNTLHDTLIDMSNFNKTMNWERVDFNIPLKAGCTQLKYTFINSQENTDMILTDVSIE
jgi:hypothetical protein